MSGRSGGTEAQEVTDVPEGQEVTGVPEGQEVT
jgi:hypothetical protein